MTGRGRLVIVSCGIELGRHINERTLSEIESADVVFVMADAFVQQWLRSLRPDCQSLARYYGDTKDRRQTYREMETVILESVRAGRRVCAVFYGHPGVFAQVPHNAIRLARAEGFPARMEAGISADACLYADLGMDPGDCGLQSFEATRFLISQYLVNPAALLILWQVALSGNLDCIGFRPNADRLQILVDKLLRWYPANTPVLLYEAARLPIQRFRADWLALVELPRARYREYTTLVIPPVNEPDRDEEVLSRLSN